MQHRAPATPETEESCYFHQVGCFSLLISYRASGLQELAFSVKMLRPYKTESVGLIA